MVLMRNRSNLLTQLTPEKKRSYRAAGCWRGGRFYEFVEGWAGERGDATAVVDSRGRWAYTELLERVGALVGALVGLGVEPGDVVAIWTRATRRP